MIYELPNGNRVRRLFDGWEETMIWSCLEGVMGRLYADDKTRPRAAVAVLGDFAFFAGEVSEELVRGVGGRCPADSAAGGQRDGGCLADSAVGGRPAAPALLVPQNAAWKDILLAHYAPNARLITRYATKKEPDIFDRKALKKAASSLPAGCTLTPINEPLYHRCKAASWSRDLVAQFPTYQSYRRLGLGIAAQRDGEILSGASSYSRYSGGIEIEIDTALPHRRQGLATACAAALILECLTRRLYPSWDAHNRESLALAASLGYHYSHTYETVDISGEM